MKTKMKNRSRRHDISRARSRHAHNYSKYKKCLGMVMLVHLSNIWSSIYEKVKQNWGWVEKSVAYKKKRV